MSPTELQIMVAPVHSGLVARKDQRTRGGGIIAAETFDFDHHQNTVLFSHS